MTLEIDKRARSIFVPADIEEQKNFLRSMDEPVTLFGERPEDRRTRLQRFLAAKELAGDGGAIPAAFSSSAYGARAEKQTEMFYSPASEHLLAARQFMGRYSFERAAKRLRAQASVASSEEACAAEDRYAAKVYKSLKRMRPVLSQVADERPLSTCALSSDGSLLATGSWGSVVKVWDAHSCEPIALMRGHSDRVVSVAWHPAAGRGRGSSAAVHGTHTGQSDAHLGAARGMLVSGSIDGTAMLWKVPEELLGHHESAMPGLDSSSGHNNHASALDVGLREVATLKGHTQRLANVAFHPSGRYVGTSSYDRTWRLWDVERHHEVLLQEVCLAAWYALFYPHSLHILCFSLSFQIPVIFGCCFRLIY
jgi:U4/U6 small nuclear ribonucleoprotein PRP4